MILTARGPFGPISSDLISRLLELLKNVAAFAEKPELERTSAVTATWLRGRSPYRYRARAESSALRKDLLMRTSHSAHAT